MNNMFFNCLVCHFAEFDSAVQHQRALTTIEGDTTDTAVHLRGNRRSTHLTGQGEARAQVSAPIKRSAK